MSISAPLLAPSKCSGSVDTVCNSFRTPAAGVVRERRDRRGQLVDDVGESAVRAKHHVARAGARLERRKRRIVGASASRAPRRTVGQDLVQPEVAHEHEAIRGIQRHAVRVRSLLAFGIDAFAGVLYDVGGRAEPAVGATGSTDTLPLP